MESMKNICFCFLLFYMGHAKQLINKKNFEIEHCIALFFFWFWMMKMVLLRGRHDSQQFVFSICVRCVCDVFSFILPQVDRTGMRVDRRRRVPIPESIQRCQYAWVDMMRPRSGRNVDWCRVFPELRNATEEEILACVPLGHLLAGGNALHTICQFNQGPTSPGGQKRAYDEAAAVIVRVYKEHSALDWRSGQKDDTAMAKACAVGNEDMIRLLIPAGASAHPLGYSNLIPRPSVCFQDT